MSSRYIKANKVYNEGVITLRRERSRSSQYEDKIPTTAKSPYVRHQKHRPALGEWVDELSN